MPELTLLNESVVQAEEIDSLGHMNVRFYIARATAANAELLKRAGYWQGDTQTQSIRRFDTYTRFRQEQFENAPLKTLGGLVASESPDSDAVSSYFEVRNPDSNSVAASFIFKSSVIDRATDEATVLSPVRQDDSLSVAIPDHGQPRTVSLSDPKPVVMADVLAIAKDEPTPGMMSGIREGEVLPEDCGSDGKLREDTDVMFILHRQLAKDADGEMGPPVLRDKLGRRYSWAVMETRNLTLERPSLGDQIIAAGADLDHGEKWRWSRRWMFNKATGETLAVSDTVAVCIDLDARRAIAVPDEVLKSLRNKEHQDLI